MLVSFDHSRADLTIVCKGMEFGLYPFDKHVCYLKLTSCECSRLTALYMAMHVKKQNNVTRDENET